MIFIIDTNVEDLAVKEALKLNIPIIAILDTNSDPTGINFPVPGNDDARRAINLYCELVKQTVLDAQKNVNANESFQVETEFKKTQGEILNKETKKVEVKKEIKQKKKEKIKKISKISKSILSKVKSIATSKKK